MVGSTPILCILHIPTQDPPCRHVLQLGLGAGVVPNYLRLHGVKAHFYRPWAGDGGKAYGVYPLVICYIAIENGHL